LSSSGEIAWNAAPRAEGAAHSNIPASSKMKPGGTQRTKMALGLLIQDAFPENSGVRPKGCCVSTVELLFGEARRINSTRMSVPCQWN